MIDFDFAPSVELHTEVEGVHREPGESGQHEIMHESGHEDAADGVLRLCHKVVDQKSEVKQEHGQHQMDKDQCGLAGSGLPVDPKENNLSAKTCSGI